MNEADALSFVINELNIYLSGNTPASPAGIRWMLNEIHHRLGEKRKTAAKEINTKGAYHEYEQSGKPKFVATSHTLPVGGNGWLTVANHEDDVPARNVDNEISVKKGSRVKIDSKDPEWREKLAAEIYNAGFPEWEAGTTPTRPCEPGETADLAIKIGDGPWQEFKSDPFQHYWRCDHFPVAIDNFFAGRTPCICIDLPAIRETPKTKWKCDVQGCQIDRIHGHTQ